MKTATMMLNTFVIVAMTATVGVMGVEYTTKIRNIEIVLGATIGLLLAMIHTKIGQIHIFAAIVTIMHLFARNVADIFAQTTFMNTMEMIFVVSAMIP